jgi:PAS domain S-box-containing protein
MTPCKNKTELEMEDMINILNHVPLNIIITDLEGVIIWCNDVASEFTGYSKEDMIGENPRILKQDDNDP